MSDNRTDQTRLLSPGSTTGAAGFLVQPPAPPAAVDGRPATTPRAAPAATPAPAVPASALASDLRRMLLLLAHNKTKRATIKSDQRRVELRLTPVYVW